MLAVTLPDFLKLISIFRDIIQKPFENSAMEVILNYDASNAFRTCFIVILSNHLHNTEL